MGRTVWIWMGVGELEKPFTLKLLLALPRERHLTGEGSMLQGCAQPAGQRRGSILLPSILLMQRGEKGDASTQQNPPTPHPHTLL